MILKAIEPSEIEPETIVERIAVDKNRNQAASMFLMNGMIQFIHSRRG